LLLLRSVSVLLLAATLCADQGRRCGGIGYVAGIAVCFAHELLLQLPQLCELCLVPANAGSI
jgi:hypothetical protein